MMVTLRTIRGVNQHTRREACQAPLKPSRQAARTGEGIATAPPAPGARNAAEDRGEVAQAITPPPELLGGRLELAHADAMERTKASSR